MRGHALAERGAPWMRDLAQAYLHSVAMPAFVTPRVSPAPAQRAAGIAGAYEGLRSFNESSDVLTAWRAMASAERSQFDFIARHIQIEPWRGVGQPYFSSGAMRKDVIENARLFVFTGGDPHPCRSSAQVFRGRAVHDIFGHVLAGSDFSAHGELLAFRYHARLYPRKAWPALATDNLGQTYAYYFGAANLGRPHPERVWPEQKVDCLPAALWEDLL